MTKLNEEQEELLTSVRKAMTAATQALEKIKEDFEAATFRLKTATIDAIKAAEDGGVPFSRITRDGMGFSYPQETRNWMEPPSWAKVMVDGVATVDPVKPTKVTKELHSELKATSSVTRNTRSGIISVVHNGEAYKIKATGPDGECWATKDQKIPDEVYQKITATYPGFVALEDSDD